MTTHKKHENGEHGGLGGAVVGLGAAAALVGVYLLYGSKKGPSRRRKARSWMLKMRAEILEEIENLRDVTEDAYYNVVDKVKTKYKDMRDVTSEEVDEVAQEIKEGWNDVMAEGEAAKEDVKEELEETVNEEKAKHSRKKE